MKLLFAEEPPEGVRTCCLVLLSLLLMFSDYRYHQLTELHKYFSFVIYPIQWCVNAPMRLTANVNEYVTTYKNLIKENKTLKETEFLLKAQLQKYHALEAENDHLRLLLQSSKRDSEKFLAAEIIRVDSDPSVHRMILDKGSKDGVTVGQSVIDVEGVVGEVIEVYPTNSLMILLSDRSYGIPVENIRNGVRGIVAGTGKIKNLELQHVPNTVDLKIGDRLVTSGLEGRYPRGYPVGVIHEINHARGESFAKIEVMPHVHLERCRHVLLIQSQKRAET